MKKIRTNYSVHEKINMKSHFNRQLSIALHRACVPYNKAAHDKMDMVDCEMNLEPYEVTLVKNNNRLSLGKKKDVFIYKF